MKLNSLYKPAYLFLFVFVFLATLKSHRTFLGQGDEPHYLVAAQSLAFDFDVDLKNNYASPFLRAFNDQQYHAILKNNGDLMPYHSVGLSILLIPSSLLAHGIIALMDNPSRDDAWKAVKNVASFSMMALAGLFALLFFQFFLSVGFEKPFAWVLAGFLMVTPSLLNYGFLLFPALPTAFLIFYLFTRLSQEQFHWVDQLLIGFLPWLSPRNYLISGVFLALFIFASLPLRNQSPKRIILGLFSRSWLTILLWAGVFSLNHYMWGSLSPASPWENSGLKVFDPQYLNQALPGLFLDRSYGLIPYAPLYGLCFGGFYFLYHKNPKMFWTVSALLFPIFFAVSGYWDWKGGWSPGPRYLTPAVPLLAVGLGFFLREVKNLPSGKKWLWFFMGGSFILSLLYWQEPRNLWPGYTPPDIATGENRFLTDWLGPWGQTLQGIFPNVVYPSKTEYLKLAFHILFLIGLNFSAIRLLKRKNA